VDPEWPKPTTAKNPYGLAGCPGAKVELVPKFDSCICEWEIVQVKPVVRDVVADLGLDCVSEACSLEKAALKNVLVWSCDESVCDAPTWETFATGTWVDVMDDLSLTCVGETGCTGKGLEKSYARVCVLCSGEVPEPGLLEFTSQTLTRLVKVEEGSECSDCKLRYETITLCGLWCEAETGDTVAYTAEPVAALTDVSIDCEGIHKTKQTVYALCTCDEEEEDSETTIVTEVLAGDCIEVSTQDCKTTVSATTNVIGGDGIIVSKQGCTYSVSLSSGQGDPKTTLRMLCGVEISPITIQCVESSGGWSFQVSGGEVTEKYSYLTVPSSIIEESTECEGGSSGGGSSGGGDGIAFNGLDCSSHPNHLSFTFLGMPEGAVHYRIVVAGDQGSGVIPLPSEEMDEVPGQEYWAPLNEDWGDAQPGECFDFTAEFVDGDGNVVSTQTYEACCE
jgi:hypothetical protein